MPKLFRVIFNSSFKEVFPQLPVIAITLEEEFVLIILDILVNKSKEFFTFICLLKFFLLLILFTIAKDAPLFKASFTNLLPSLFFPFIAKKRSFFLISFELIDPFLIFVFIDIFLFFKISFKIFNFKSFFKNLFFFRVYLSIHSLSEKYFLYFP